jgi:uncharacterized protein YbjT (DUF2867 family)
MPDQRVISVAGATGFVGRHTVQELLSRGYEVRALVRDLEKARAVLRTDSRLSLLQGDASEPESLRGLMQGSVAIVNAVGILREGKGASFQRQHVEATRNLAQAARDAGALRFVQVSALGVSDTAATEYQRSKFEAERVLRRSGLAWTILRPSLIHGVGSEFLKTAKGWVKGTKQPWFFLPYFSRGMPASDVPLAPMKRIEARVAPVAVEDVAWAAVECIERPDTIGEIINLTGPDELSWPEMLRAIQHAIPDSHEGLNPLAIPSEIAAIQARIAKALGLGSMLPFDEGMAIMGAMDSVANSDKARALLSFNPRPFRATLKRYAARI